MKNQQTARERMCSFGAGLALALLALVFSVVTVAMGRDEEHLLLPGWLTILLNTLLCAWFTCSLIKAARKVRREEAGA